MIVKKSTAFWLLIRPANILTSWIDILAAFGIVAIPIILGDPHQYLFLGSLLLLLLIATTGLYGGGVVLNDVCDAELDKIERPERPIPQGVYTKKQATIIAFIFLGVGTLAAFCVSLISGLIALAIDLLIFNYNLYEKNSLWLGPLNMALCRSSNLLLGISIIPIALSVYWPLLFLPLFFISGVTLISKGEVQGSHKSILYVALLLYILTFVSVLMIKKLAPSFSFLHAAPFLAAFVAIAFTTNIRAILHPDPMTSRKAVKLGILSWTILDCAIASGFVGIWYGLIIFLLLFVVLVLSRRFAIT